MGKVYEFNGYDPFKINILLLLVFISIVLILLGILKGVVFFFSPLTVEVAMTLSITIALLSMITMIAYAVIKDRSSTEHWKVSFNGEKIEIGSDKKSKKVFYISQLAKVYLFKDSALHIKKRGIAMSFQSEGERDKKIRIHLSISYFSKRANKNNYNHFNEFLEDFEKQVLKDQFKQVKSLWVRAEAIYVRK